MENEYFCGLCKRDKKMYREKAYFSNKICPFNTTKAKSIFRETTIYARNM
jgi:hypothetical protein